MNNKLKELAVKLFDLGAIKYGDFTTKIGLKTPIYIDLRIIISYPDLLTQLSESLWSLSDSEEKCSHICGIPYTALPIATAISIKNNIPMLMVRKEAKSYGTKKMIEGIYAQNDKCIIIEDIVTSGSSILETIQHLKKENLKVETALVIVDREQGGKAILKNKGIEVKSLFTMTLLIQCLFEANKIDQKSVDRIKEYIKNTQSPCEKNNIIKSSRPNESFASRAEKTKNVVAAKLLKLMDTKQTTLCLAADLTETESILEIAEIAGPHIAVLKCHVDIIEDFTPHFIQRLRTLAKTHNFLLMEDRKFGDIGQIVSYQYRKGIYKIAEWADLITVHPISGTGVINGLKDGLEGLAEDRGIFLVAEMSSSGALTTGDYIKSTVSMGEKSELVAGFVCQSDIFSDPGMIQLTPGVKLASSVDELGQQYNTPHQVVKAGGDLIVVGRGITQAKDRLSEILKYKNVLWSAYQERLTS